MKGQPTTRERPCGIPEVIHLLRGEIKRRAEKEAEKEGESKIMLLQEPLQILKILFTKEKNGSPLLSKETPEK